ncbi:8-amino-7-oxononanoate synthase [compost metagenome]
MLRRESWRREHLAALIAHFRAGAEAIGLTLMDSPTPIQPILIGGSRQAVELSAELRGHGIMVGAIRPPTVPAGSARLRVTLSAAHSEAQVDRLLDALADSWQRVSSTLLAEIEGEEGDDA